VALAPDRLEVELSAQATPSLICYELTNVALPPQPLHPSWQNTASILQRVPDYSRVMKALQVHKDIRVTGELRCRSDAASITFDFESYARALCDVLSVANGTPVQWITSTYLDAAEEPIRRIHNAGITKDYSGHHLISPHRADTSQLFLDVALPAYGRKRQDYRLDSGTISAYLDAKAEHDFLELRGVKAVVAMEMLRTTMLNIPHVGISSTIVDPRAYEEMSPLIAAALRDRLGCSVSSNDKAAMLAHVPALNRRSFRNHLRKIVRFLGASISATEQQLFIACRNKLVHECAFYCQAATESERKEIQPLETRWAEYSFLTHVLDRLFLALFEYPGAYYDWTPREGPKLSSSGWSQTEQ
jgi:hypothetical protein